jgi:hypothetical protein
MVASALTLMVLMPVDAEAQRRGVRVGGAYRAVGVRAVRPGYGVAVARRGYYGGYRGGYYRPGLGLAVGAGAIAAGAAAAAAASPYYGGYGYGGYGYPYGGYAYPAANPCLRQQQVWNGYGYQLQWVQVC